MKNIADIEKEKYYESILNIIKRNKFNFAKTELIKFLDLYPYEEDAVICYLKILLKHGELNEAMNLCEEYIYNDGVAFYYALILKNYGNNEEAKEILLNLFDRGNERALVVYITILIKELKYKEAYKYYLLISTEYRVNHIVEMDVLRRNIYKHIFPELNETMSFENLPYFSEQIVKYSEDRLINKLQLYGDEKNSFRENIDLLDVIKYAKARISSLKPLYYDVFDKYIIRYPNIGFSNRKNTNYIAVITNINTKEIVNIYPCNCSNKIILKQEEELYKKYKME